MNEEQKKQLREILLDRFEVDIDRAQCHFSTQNYAFVFPGEPYMIRVSINPKKTRQEILSELMWLDDLKQFKQTICEPALSPRGNLLEEFEMDGRICRASMFRTARGVLELNPKRKPMYFVCVGELLGAIHQVSTEEQELGIRFRRKKKEEAFAALKARVADRVPPEILARIGEIEAEVNALPQTLGRYGLCHGDFHENNFFVEENNIWVFDFDSCGYDHYLYDVASFFQSCFLHGYGAGRDLRQVLQEELLPYFQMGYTLNKTCDEDYWQDLELFLSYRAALTYMALLEIDTIGVAENVQGIRQFFAYIVGQEDILGAMTRAMSHSGGIR